MIREMGFECSKYHNEMTKQELSDTENNLQNILITTFISAKGMEFDIVIIPEFQYFNINPAAEAKKYYVGCTRAKKSLFLLHTGNQPAILNSFPSDAYSDGSLFSNNSSTPKTDIPLPTDADDLPF
jgi:superfamily I DNA/RNA helicase